MYDCMRIIECTFQMFACKANTHTYPHTHTHQAGPGEHWPAVNHTPITICYGYNA